MNSENDELLIKSEMLICPWPVETPNLKLLILGRNVADEPYLYKMKVGHVVSGMRTEIKSLPATPYTYEHKYDLVEYDGLPERITWTFGSEPGRPQSATNESTWIWSGRFARNPVIDDPFSSSLYEVLMSGAMTEGPMINQIGQICAPLIGITASEMIMHLRGVLADLGGDRR